MHKLNLAQVEVETRACLLLDKRPQFLREVLTIGPRQPPLQPPERASSSTANAE